MKTIAVIIAVMLITLSLSAQNSKSLLKERNKEIEAVKEVGYNPATEAEKIEAINVFYAPLIESAIKAENEKKEKPATTTVQVDNTTKTRSSIGADVIYQGDQGSFSGKSVSVKNGAEAYATVSMADANAYLVRSMADGSTTKMSAPDLSIGMEGTIINKYRYQELEVKIVGINPGNNYNKTFLLGKDQSITDYLLPGTYRAYIKGLNNSQASAQEFVVTADKVHNVNGKNVYWGIWGGTNW
jgi:hypothetical protein